MRPLNVFVIYIFLSIKMVEVHKDNKEYQAVNKEETEEKIGHFFKKTQVTLVSLI